MNAEARLLDQCVRDWWLQGRDDLQFRAILDAALSGRPMNVLPFARALAVLRQKDLPASLRSRIGDLDSRLSEMKARQWQVDSLGDLDNEPETVFEILGDELSNLSGYDSERIRRARLAQQGRRSAAAQAVLDTLGWDSLLPVARDQLRLAIADLDEREQYQSWGLFIDREANTAIALGMKVVLTKSGNQLFANCDAETSEQARIAASRVLKDCGWEMNIEWPASFVGESVGLPIAIAALTARGELPHNALVASTGRVDLDGKVTGISGVQQKVDAAVSVGMRRILVPQENLDEAKRSANSRIVVVPVSHLDELVATVRQSVTAVELGFAGLVRLVRSSTKDYKLAVLDEATSSSGHAFVVGNTSGKVRISVYTTGRVSAQGAEGAVLEAAKKLILDRVPGDPEPRQPHSFQSLTPEFRERIRSKLENLGARSETPHEHESWRLRLTHGRSRASVVLYKKGSCVLQGTAPAWDVAFDAINDVMAPVGGLVLPAATTEQTVKVENDIGPNEPHIGTDEAGKGDYFGPLVSAAVYVDKPLAARLTALGVRDSKKLSDNRVRQLAAAIREAAVGRFAVTPINPPKYNELYAEFKTENKNLNSLLAWGHARSIERLLNAPADRGIRPQFALVDQFANERYVGERTKHAGIPVFQRPKAESDIAVAAASVLARDAFLTWMERWSELTKLKLPKGASSEVVQSAKEFVRLWGRGRLRDVAKLHFQTTAQVLDGEVDRVNYPSPPWAQDEREFTRER